MTTISLKATVLSIALCVLPAHGLAQSKQAELFKQFDAATRKIKEEKDPLKAYQHAQSIYNDPNLASLKSMLVQALANQYNLVGKYREAEALNFSKARVTGQAFPDGASTRPAAHAVAELAQAHRVVMLNEAHTIARTRLLTLELLAPLRKAGFTHLALETLSHNDPVNQRGYPVWETGYYTTEPVFAEMIREALRLGYILVPYEYNGDESGQQARETGQAENLAQLLGNHLNARVIVHAGHAHIHKDSRYMPDKARSMASELMRLTGIKPLSIEQTTFIDHPDPAKQHPFRAKAVSLWQEQHGGSLPTQPFILQSGEGTPWSLHPASNDISVFMAPWHAEWGELSGLRSPVPLASNFCIQYPCVVQARYAGETHDGVPADNLLVEAPSQTKLWLRDGCYRITSVPQDNPATTDPAPLCVGNHARKTHPPAAQ